MLRIPRISGRSRPSVIGTLTTSSTPAGCIQNAGVPLPSATAGATDGGVAAISPSSASCWPVAARDHEEIGAGLLLVFGRDRHQRRPIPDLHDRLELRQIRDQPRPERDVVELADALLVDEHGGLGQIALQLRFRLTGHAAADEIHGGADRQHRQHATTAEAIDLLRRLPHAMQYNYSLLDAGGAAAVVEAGAGAVAARLGDWLACTNHFQSPQLRRLNRRVAHSIDRLPPLEGWAARRLTAEQTFQALNFAVSPAFHNYGNGTQTLHTIVAEPAKLRLLVGIGGDAAALDEDMLDVDFKLWVDGEDLPTKQLKGQLGLGWQAPRRTRARR